MIDGVRHIRIQYTDTCSGCYESNEGYSWSWDVRDKNGVVLGMGCRECGYTGKRRHDFYMPDYERHPELLNANPKQGSE